jgi:hypothetical protein
MGLFNFLKPRNSTDDDLNNRPAIRKALIAADLESTQKQIANLQAVGRVGDAQKLASVFRQRTSDYLQATFHEWNKSDLVLPTAIDIAQISFGIAYFVLPNYGYKEFQWFLGVWHTPAPPIAITLYEYGCSIQKVRPTSEFAVSFKTQDGQLSPNCSYYLLQYPTPPSLDPMLTSGAEDFSERAVLPPQKRPVLAPYFSAILDDNASGKRSYYTLGQSMEGGTIIRHVTTAEGRSSCLGRGPEPTVDAFLEHLKEHHAS